MSFNAKPLFSSTTTQHVGRRTIIQNQLNNGFHFHRNFHFRSYFIFCAEMLTLNVTLEFSSIMISHSTPDIKNIIILRRASKAINRRNKRTFVGGIQKQSNHPRRTHIFKPKFSLSTKSYTDLEY